MQTVVASPPTLQSLCLPAAVVQRPAYHAGTASPRSVFPPLPRPQVASSFLDSDDGGAAPKGIVFKIKTKTPRSINLYSYYPDEGELLLPPNSMFRVDGLYAATDFNMAYGLPQDDDWPEFRCHNLGFVTPGSLTMQQAQNSSVVMVLMTETEAAQ